MNNSGLSKTRENVEFGKCELEREKTEYGMSVFGRSWVHMLYVEGTILEIC